MKIFITVSRVPWPIEKGDKLRIYNQIKQLKKSNEIILCCLNDKPTHPDAKKELEKICNELHIFNLKKATILFQLFLGIFSSKPFQVHYFYQKNIRKKVYDLIEKTKPDTIYAQLIRTSEYVKHIHNIPKTLDYMDTFSKGISRRIKKANFLFRIILRSEARKLMNYENLIFDYFENHTIISEQDRNFLPHNDQQKIIVVPNGIDQSFFKPIVNCQKDYEILFTGNMNYPPNVEGALYIIKEIMPVVWQTKPNAKVIIAGANPSSKLKNLATEKVIIKGWMDDIRDAYNGSKLFLAPMKIGTGLQNKLLEALSMNMPCITSKLANNALNAKPNKEILIGSTVEEYANHINFLLDNKTESGELAKNGQEFVHNNFSWEGSTQILESLLKSK